MREPRSIICEVEKKDLCGLSLKTRRQILEDKFSKLLDGFQLGPVLNAPPRVMLERVRDLGLEGVVAKHKESLMKWGRG